MCHRYLFDFEFIIEWEAVGTPHKGKLVFHDISNDGEYEISCQYEKKPSDTINCQTLHSAVTCPKSGLKHALLEKIEVFVAEFQKL